MVFQSFIGLMVVLTAGLTLAAGEPAEFDPTQPRAEEILREFDEVYERKTGLPAFPMGELFETLLSPEPTCYRQTCRIWALIDKTEQKLHLYLDGNPSGSWDVSTGTRSHETPRFDQHPNGRMYTKLTSARYPGGDYKGLGNMPYAVFIRGPYALHGTPESNWKKLGRRASHGCIRMHPDKAKYFFELIKSAGPASVWITVQ